MFSSFAFLFLAGPVLSVPFQGGEFFPLNIFTHQVGPHLAPSPHSLIPSILLQKPQVSRHKRHRGGQLYEGSAQSDHYLCEECTDRHKSWHGDDSGVYTEDDDREDVISGEDEEENDTAAEADDDDIDEHALEGKHTEEENQDQESETQLAESKLSKTTGGTHAPHVEDQSSSNDYDGESTSSLKPHPHSETHPSKPSQAYPKDCTALSHIYSDMGGSGWTVSTGWNDKTKLNSCCNWYGVTCSGRKVTALDLVNNRLTGNLSTSVFSLTDIQRLNLSRNAIEGDLPDQFGSLEKLDHIFLDNNKFLGSIPPSLTNSQVMTTLHLSHNSFSGLVDLSNCSSLANIYLDHNLLSSLELGNIEKLIRLVANDNKLAGNLPNLTKSTRVQIINLARNKLTGELFNLQPLAKLTNFDVRSNQISGPFPPSLVSLKELESFHISSNTLSGEFPSSRAPPSLKSCTILPNMVQSCQPPYDAGSLAVTCQVSCEAKKVVVGKQKPPPSRSQAFPIRTSMNLWKYVLVLAVFVV